MQKGVTSLASMDGGVHQLSMTSQAGAPKVVVSMSKVAMVNRRKVGGRRATSKRLDRA